METRAEIINACTITAVTDNTHAGSGDLVSFWQGQERSLQHVVLNSPAARGASVCPSSRPSSLALRHPPARREGQVPWCVRAVRVMHLPLSASFRRSTSLPGTRIACAEAAIASWSPGSPAAAKLEYLSQLTARHSSPPPPPRPILMGSG